MSGVICTEISLFVLICIEQFTKIPQEYWAMLKMSLECVFFPLLFYRNPVSDLSQALADVGRALGGPPQIILFILPQEGEEIKRKIKYTCETNGHDYGVATQCVVSETYIMMCDIYLIPGRFQRSKKVANPNNQYLNNIGLKLVITYSIDNPKIQLFRRINARLGGENSVVNHPAMTKFRSGKKLVLGMSSYHIFNTL